MIPLSALGYDSVALATDFLPGNIIVDIYKLNMKTTKFEYAATEIVPSSNTTLNFDYVVYGMKAPRTEFEAKQIASNPVLLENYYNKQSITMH